MDKGHYTGSDGKFQPALAKLNIYKYSTYDETLYIDADSLCFKDLQPLFDRLKGRIFASHAIEGYTQWTDEETYKNFFKQDWGITINTSWFYFEDNKVFITALDFYNNNFPADKISPVWGGTYPDELFFNAAIKKTGVDAKVDFDVMFFGNNIDVRTFTELENDFYFYTLYGNRTTVRKIYIDWYDRLMYKICANKGIEHRFKSYEILVGKHVNL